MDKNAFSHNPVGKMFLAAATMNTPSELDAPGPAYKRPNNKPSELDAPGPAYKRPHREALMKSPEEEKKVIKEVKLPAVDKAKIEVVRDICGDNAEDKCKAAVLVVVKACYPKAAGEKDEKPKIHDFLDCVLAHPSLAEVKSVKGSQLIKMRAEQAKLPNKEMFIASAQKAMCDSLSSIKDKGACNTRVESDVSACYQGVDNVHKLSMCLEKTIATAESVQLLESGEVEDKENHMTDTQVLPSLAVLQASAQELHCQKVVDAQHKADCNTKMQAVVSKCYDTCHADTTVLDKVYCFQGCNEAGIDEQMGSGKFNAMLQADKPKLDDNYNMGYDKAMKKQQADIDAGLLDIEGIKKAHDEHQQVLIQSAKRHAAKLKNAAVAKKNAVHKAKMKLGKTAQYYNYEEPTYDGHDDVTVN